MGNESKVLSGLFAHVISKTFLCSSLLYFHINALALSYKKIFFAYANNSINICVHVIHNQDTNPPYKHNSLEEKLPLVTLCEWFAQGLTNPPYNHNLLLTYSLEKEKAH